MSTAAIVSVEEFLRRSDKPLCEYREGVLYPKAMPTKLHGLMEFLLITLLRNQGLEALAEVTVRLNDRKWLVPDVIAAPSIESPYPTNPVLLCCEILSPEDRLGAMLAKCEEYHTWGVPFCWVIDPVKQTAWEYHAGSEPQRAADTLGAGQIAIRLADLFSRIA